MLDNQKEKSRFQIVMETIEIEPIDLASILEISKEYVYMVRDGLRPVSRKLANKMNAIFGVPVDYLMNISDDLDFTPDKNVITGIKSAFKDFSKQVNQTNQIPMYNLPATAGEVEVYNNPDDVKVIGYLNIPGAHKESVALPAYGHSMYPTIANGDWAVSRPISNPTEIVWGEVYYIEWSDYKMYKRLLRDKSNDDNVILWSDNQLDRIGDYPKYAELTITKESIRKLRLVTEILKKPNY